MVNNEDGFTRANVEAITSVNASTKADSDDEDSNGEQLTSVIASSRPTLCGLDADIRLLDPGGSVEERKHWQQRELARNTSATESVDPSTLCRATGTTEGSRCGTQPIEKDTTNT